MFVVTLLWSTRGLDVEWGQLTSVLCVCPCLCSFRAVCGPWTPWCATSSWPWMWCCAPPPYSTFAPSAWTGMCCSPRLLHVLFVTYARFLISLIFSSVNALRIKAVSLNYCLPLRVNNLISTFTAWRCLSSPSFSATTTQNIPEAEARRCCTNDETLRVGHLSSEEVISLPSVSSCILLEPLSEAGRQTWLQSTCECCSKAETCSIISVTRSDYRFQRSSVSYICRAVRLLFQVGNTSASIFIFNSSTKKKVVTITHLRWIVYT